MNVQQFLLHHGVVRNPFAAEDAQTDAVFRDHCLRDTYHPCWDKLLGDPAQPASAVVFGDRGSGKTALRLQLAEHVARHNRDFPDRRAYLIEYDDFGPFLDRFLGRARRPRSVARRLADWQVSDHLDAILSLGVTRLVDDVLQSPGHAESLTRGQAKDLLLLAACYDQPAAEPTTSRWQRLRRTPRFDTRRARWALALGLVMTVAAMAMGWFAEATPWPYAVAGIGWLPWLFRGLSRWWLACRVAKRLRVLRHRPSCLRHLLAQFFRPELASHPLPTRGRTDSFVALRTFQKLLRALGYHSIIVVVDRVEEGGQETHAFRASPEGLQAWLRPLLDGQLLKQPGIGFKLLLPRGALAGPRDDLDSHVLTQVKNHNLAPSLDWSGQRLYDVATARLSACGEGGCVALRDLFDGEVTEARLTEALGQLSGPRESLRFLNDVLAAHSDQHTANRPSWRISTDTLESVLARYGDDAVCKSAPAQRR